MSGLIAPASVAGTVQYFGMNEAPVGWLKANGAAVSRTAYAALFLAVGTAYGVGDGATTFNLPDLRGEFIRGFDDGRGVDAARVIGTAQDDAMQGHRHEICAANWGQAGYSAGINSYFQANGSNNTIGPADIVKLPKTDGTNGMPRTAAESRPRNIAMLACIKY